MDPTIQIKLSNILPHLQSRLAHGDANIHTDSEAQCNREEELKTGTNACMKN